MASDNVQQVRRNLIHFGATHIFDDAFATGMIGFTIYEDEYEKVGDALEREPPVAVLYFPGTEIELAGEDFDAFKRWYEAATGKKRVELASVAP